MDQIAARLRSLLPWTVFVLLAPGCQAVNFTEKRHLADPIMEMGGGAGETHFQQKVYYSREGSAGGIGASAGGGCGCY